MRYSAVLAMALLSVSQARAACGPVCARLCGEECSQPAMQWITVTETITRKVPVQRWVEEEIQTPAVVRKLVQREEPVTVLAPRVETVAGTTRKMVWEEQTYDGSEMRPISIERQGVRKVFTKVPVCVERQVTRTVYDTLCDPVTGRVRRVPRKVTLPVKVDTFQVVAEEVPFTYTRKAFEPAPVIKTRQVVKWMDLPYERKVTRLTQDTEMQMVDHYVEETVMTTQVNRKLVTELVEKQFCVTRRVKVPTGAPSPSPSPSSASEPPSVAQAADAP